MGAIAKTALPPPLSLNPIEARGEGASPSLGVALTIGQALTMEQEPVHPPLLSSIQPGRMSTWDVAGIYHYVT